VIQSPGTNIWSLNQNTKVGAITYKEHRPIRSIINLTHRYVLKTATHPTTMLTSATVVYSLRNSIKADTVFCTRWGRRKVARIYSSLPNKRYSNPISVYRNNVRLF